MEIPSNEFRGRNKVFQDKKIDAGKKALAKPANASSGKASSNGSEQIALSSKAKDIQKAHEAIQSAPDIRVEKVLRLKAEIAEGRFKVDSDALAGKILEEILKESKFFE